MNKLVRGGIVLSIMVTFVAFVYAQTRTQTGLSSAKSTSQNLVAGSFIASEVAIDNLVLETPVVNDDAKKMVKKTVSSKAVSRGSFTATAYCLKGRTALGHGVRRGIIAADPRVLKLGSSINLGAGAYSGTYLVSDTGGNVKGRKIDIWMPSCAEARRFGRRTVTVN
jgi:3D (Asp-Asp-Asp) domain-containing protein